MLAKNLKRYFVDPVLERYSALIMKEKQFKYIFSSF